VTFGHFWTDRPYNVYHWLDASTGETLGYYFNVSEDTRVEGDTLWWRDLIVDVLLSPAGIAVVLDENEIPAEAPETLRAQIRQSCATVLRDAGDLRRELDRHRDILWRRHRAGGRPD
jgi:predicted RNA-binding protein associated with RNAse of E/G family